jgi:hypothetical protein
MWRFHLNTGIDGIYVDENIVEKTALCDVFCVFTLWQMTLYLAENVGMIDASYCTVPILFQSQTLQLFIVRSCRDDPDMTYCSSEFYTCTYETWYTFSYCI